MCIVVEKEYHSKIVAKLRKVASLDFTRAQVSDVR